MVLRVEQHGIIARCRECGALNPNPDKLTCWHCGKDGLCCPNPSHRRSASILRYDILDDSWKCWNTACGTKYTWCKECGQATLEKFPKGLWACTNCHASGSSPKRVVKINLDVFNSPIRSAETVEPQPEVKTAEPNASGTIPKPSICPKCMSTELKWNPYGGFWECTNCGYVFDKQNVNVTEPRNGKINGPSTAGFTPNAQQNPKRHNMGWIAAPLSVLILVGLVIGIIHTSHRNHDSALSIATTPTSVIATPRPYTPTPLQIVPTTPALAPAMYMLNVSISGGGSVLPHNGEFTGGQNLKLMATPSPGYLFSGWAGSASGNSNPLAITLNSNMNIVALFIAETPEPPVTITGAVGPASNSLEGENKISMTKSIRLVKNEWVKGTVSGSTTNHDSFMVTDPSNTVLYQTPQYMGGNGTFAFMAQTSGTYTVILTTGEIYAWSYNLTYTIYAVQ